MNDREGSLNIFIFMATGQTYKLTTDEDGNSNFLHASALIRTNCPIGRTSPCFEKTFWGPTKQLKLELLLCKDKPKRLTEKNKIPCAHSPIPPCDSRESMFKHVSARCVRQLKVNRGLWWWGQLRRSFCLQKKSKKAKRNASKSY